MTLHLDLAQSAVAARRLKRAFDGEEPGGIFGVIQTMPEEEACRGIEQELDRLLLLTSTVAIDYQRDAHALWVHARNLYDDAETRWVFDPGSVAQRPVESLADALESKGRLRYREKDTNWWHHNACTWESSFSGDPRVLFDIAGWEAHSIAAEVRRAGRFKGLGGQKILPLWLRMVSDILGYGVKNLGDLPIPADIHIVRASFSIGLLTGQFRGRFDDHLKNLVRDAWRKLGGQLDGGWMPYDEPLWQLSRAGCSKRHADGHQDCPVRTECPIGGLCPQGVIRFSRNRVEIDIGASIDLPTGETHSVAEKSYPISSEVQVDWGEINNRWVRPGRTAWKKGDIEDAERIFLDGLRSTGEDGFVALIYGGMLEDLGRQSDAHEMYSLALRKLPKKKYKDQARAGLSRTPDAEATPAAESKRSGRRWALVSCTKDKQPHICTARELYSASENFVRHLRFAEQHCDRVYVASARHGLVALDQLLGEYDRPLEDLSEAERDAWALFVAANLRLEGVGAGDTVCIHASGLYAHHLEAAVGNISARVILFDFFSEPSEDEI